MLALKLFESALNAEEVNDVKKFLEKYDRETANIMMLMAADKFQFRVAEIDGDVYTTAAELAVTIGVSSRGIRKLLQKYDVRGWKIGSVLEIPSLIREQLGLHDQDFSAILFGWQALLIIGFNGRTTNARNMREYLLCIERFGRMELYTQLNEGRTLKEKLESEFKHPQTHKDIVEAVSNDVITISRDRYISFLEMELSILKMPPMGKKRRRSPLSMDERESIYHLYGQGFGYTRIARLVKCDRATVRKVLGKKR